MTVQRTLTLLRKEAGNIRWRFDSRTNQFVATHETVGLKATISPAIPPYKLRQFAREVEQDLVETHRKQNTPFAKLRRKISNAKAGEQKAR